MSRIFCMHFLILVLANILQIEGNANCDWQLKSTANSSLSYKPLDKLSKLGAREDVVNKTLLRSLKKYFTEQFNKKVNFTVLNPNQKCTQFKALLTQFVNDYYQGYFIESDLNFKELQEDVFYYIGIMIYPNLIKRYLKKMKYIKFNRNYYDCVYKYSHRKLGRMFADQILRFIFKHYSESGAVEEMINKDETLSRNKEGYRKCVEVFIKSFDICEYSQMNKKKVYKKKWRSSSY